MIGKTLILNTIDQKPIDILEMYKNQIILVVFYHSSCLGCTGRALPIAHNLSIEFPKIQLIVVHVELGHKHWTKNSIFEIFTDSAPPFEIYLDESAQNYKKYQAEGTPHWLVFDKNGQLRHSIFISQANAHNRLLYALEEMMQE